MISGELPNILLEFSTNQLIIRFNNPKARNPLSIQILEQLNQILPPAQTCGKLLK
jgi:enoyl-CoA hydratase/carnithine racemase